MSRDLTDEELGSLKTFIEEYHFRSVAARFLNNGQIYVGSFDKIWQKGTMEDKKILFGLVGATLERVDKKKENLKLVFNELVNQRSDKKLAGIAEMETVKIGDKQSEKGSVMSKYDEETKEKLQEAVDSLSSGSKKQIKVEQIVTDSDVNKVIKSIGKLSQEDAKIIAEALDIEAKSPKSIQSEAIQQSKTGFSAMKEEKKIQETLSEQQKTHPKSLQKIQDIVAGFQDTFRTIPRGVAVDPMWFRINKQREKIYERIKGIEKQQMLTQSEHNKLLYKEATRNGGQHGADLAVIENKHGIEEYRVKYPTIDQMLNSRLIDQYAFDLAQKRHLTFVQTNLLKDILKGGGSIVVPNIEFLRQSYTEKLQRGEDYSAEFKQYQDAIQKQFGSQVAYNGEQNWQPDIGKPSRNTTAPSLQQPLQKPQMLDVKDVLVGIDQIAQYISNLSGNLNHLQLNSYKKVDDVFVNTVVQKKEPTTFKPQPGMAFKLRQLMC